MQLKQSSKTVRFGPYEADFDEGVLRKHGLPLKIQGKPLSVLQVLVEHSGRIVTRDELCRSLWTSDTFVDFDKNLSTAVNKLRDALCDTAGKAQYIETIPRKGYRFRGALESAPSPEIEAVSPDTKKRPLLSSHARKIILSAAAVLLCLIVIGNTFSTRFRKRSLTQEDGIVIGDFENSTGEAVFDDALKTALTVSLGQSPFLNVLPERQVSSTLKLMARSPVDRLTPDVAREACLRLGGSAYVTGAIGSLGNEYVLELIAADCQNHRVLAREQVTAESRDRVVEELGKAAIGLRNELGESLATVQRFDVPLEQATTSSLEALQAYSLAERTAHQAGAAQSLPYAQRAIELDPNFAMAYEAVGVHYSNLAEPARAGEYLARAYELRDHASERERLKISASYWSMSGQLEKAADAYQEAIAEYPRDVAGYNNLGIVLAQQGEYERALEITLRGAAIAPSEATLDENLAGYLIALQRYEEARQVIGKWQARKPDNYIFPSDSYGLAFFAGDRQEMSAQEKWFAGKPEYENLGLELAADTAAFSGRVKSANQLTVRAVESAIRADRKETGAIWQAIDAQREAAYGIEAPARELAARALKLAPESQGVKAEAAIAYALAGDDLRAQALSRDLRTRYPRDTQMQTEWLPDIEGQLELNKHHQELALKQLEIAKPPAEFGAVTFAPNGAGSCLYSAYIRGQAYLAAGQAEPAEAEFTKILSHGGLVWNCWTGALAHLGVARANALQARSSQGADADAARVRALAAYKDFFVFWKDAEPDVPILKEAKAEYARLR